MTAQVPDVIEYRGKQYSIAGVSGEGLFDPSEHGMKPLPSNSANWRGFACEYVVFGNTLLLDRLCVDLESPGRELFGVSPETKFFDSVPEAARANYASCVSVYEGLNHKVTYTGGLLLGEDFIDELYVHMGFHPAWKFREVHELVFDRGTLTQEADLSEKIAQVREKMSRTAHMPGLGANPGVVNRWIKECFSLKYTW